MRFVVCGDVIIDVVCNVDYDGVVGVFWRGVVARVFDVDDDGDDVAV